MQAGGKLTEEEKIKADLDHIRQTVEYPVQGLPQQFSDVQVVESGISAINKDCRHSAPLWKERLSL